MWLSSVKISFCTFRNLKTLQNFRNFNFFQIFSYILNKWPKFFHLIYNSCRFVQNFQTDNTLSDKIAILTKNLWTNAVAPLEVLSYQIKRGVGRLNYILILLQNRLDWRSQRFLKIAARFVKKWTFFDGFSHFSK